MSKKSNQRQLQSELKGMDTMKQSRIGFSNHVVKGICNVIKRNSDGNQYVNPVLSSTPSWFAFEALTELGLDKWHEIDLVCERTKKIMESKTHREGVSHWDAFYINTQKEDVINRLRNIILTLNYRFGDRLYEMNSCLVTKKLNGKMYLRLNTNKTTQSGNTSAKNEHIKSAWLHRIIQFTKSVIANT